MKVLLTGASGFLGSHVAELLDARGDTCVALVRKSSNVKLLERLKNVQLAYGSVEDAASVSKAIEGCDGVIHSAGLVKARSEAEFFEVNVGGTKNVLEAARSLGDKLRRFVHVSSLVVAGPSMDGSPVPIDAEGPMTPYGRSKLASEKMLLAEKGDVKVTILRPSYIYGPRDQESVPIYKSVKQRFLPYLGSGQNKTAVIYGADAAAACVAALEKEVPSGSVYFVDSGEDRPWIEMLKDIESAMEKPAILRFSVPFFALSGFAVASELMAKVTGKAAMVTREKVKELSAPHWVCDASKTRAELGWEPKVSWQEGTKRAAAWYRENGLI